MTMVNVNPWLQLRGLCNSTWFHVCFRKDIFQWVKSGSPPVNVSSTLPDVPPPSARESFHCVGRFSVTNKSHIISADCTCVLSAGNSVINMWSQRSIQIPHWSPTGCRHFKHFDWLQVSDTHLYLFKCIVLCRNLHLMLLTALVV